MSAGGVIVRIPGRDLHLAIDRALDRLLDAHIAFLREGCHQGDLVEALDETIDAATAAREIALARAVEEQTT